MRFMKLEDSIEEICKKVCQSQNDYFQKYIQIPLKENLKMIKRIVFLLLLIPYVIFSKY